MSIIEALVAGANQRKDACEKDFFLFCKTYLGNFFNTEPAEYHRIVIDIASTRAISEEHIAQLKPIIHQKYHDYLRPSTHLSGIIDVEPRGFGKSVRFSFAYPLWVLLYKKAFFPCVFSASQEMANRCLSQVKEEIEENEMIFEDFGDVKGGVWKTNLIYLSNGTAFASFGAGSSVRGVKHGSARPDLVICDDIMTDAVSGSKAQRDKLYRWLKRAVFALGKDAFPIIVNTIMHEDDFVCRLLDELTQGQLKDWVGVRLAARTPEGASLWPAYWSQEALAKKEKEMGSLAWSTEMMNEPISSEDSIVKQIHYYKITDVTFSNLKRYGGIDPATGAHDQCAFVTVGIDATGVIYVLESWGKRLAEVEFLSRIIATYQAWQHDSIGFEDVAFQGIYKNSLIEKAVRQGVWLPITGCKTGGLSKASRVRKIAPLIEAGIIRFREDQKELLDQLKMMAVDGPKSAYDDEVDAFCYAIDQVRSGVDTSIVLASVNNTTVANITTWARPFARSIINKIRRTS